MRRIFSCAAALSAILLSLPQAHAQKAWEYGGFLESSLQVYPRRPNASDTHAAGAARFQLWTRGTLNSRLSWRSTWDFRLDTHRDVDRRRWLDVSQRGLRQPAGAVSEFYFDLKLPHLDIRAGKQEIRWGRADGFNPTDNLISYDYLDVFSDFRIGVPAVKADAYAGSGHFEAVWIPFYTPTRLPLLGQRWFPQLPRTATLAIAAAGPELTADLSYREGSLAYPARTFGHGQWAVRWNQLVPRAEFSVSYFDGFDDIAFFRAATTLLDLGSAASRPKYLVSLNRDFYRVRVAGIDFASSLGPFGARAELAYFDQTDPNNRDHLLFVLGLDKTWGDWFVIVQYAGQKVAGSVSSSTVFPDLGLRSTMIWRVERTLGPSRSLEIKGALRLRDGDLMIQPLYNVALSNKWRLKIGATVFAGARDKFLGQYCDSSHLSLQLRYSF